MFFLDIEQFHPYLSSLESLGNHGDLLHKAKSFFTSLSRASTADELEIVTIMSSTYMSKNIKKISGQLLGLIVMSH
jgi:hypothetical protein